MDDTISRQAVLDIALKYCPDDDGTCSEAGSDLRNMLDEIEALPPAEPKRIVGRWIPSSDQCGIKCSECGLPPDDFCYSIDYIELDYAPNFCPNCGSDNRKR